MSGLVQNEQQVKWDIRETEFVIRLITNASINGSDLEQALSVLNKFKETHSKLVQHEIAR